MSLEEKATDAWAVYEYREHPKGLYHTCFVDGYQQGYEQAEKDHALTWRDIRRIVKIADDLLDDPKARVAFQNHNEEYYYKKVLDEYNRLHKTKEE